MQAAPSYASLHPYIPTLRLPADRQQAGSNMKAGNRLPGSVERKTSANSPQRMDITHQWKNGNKTGGGELYLPEDCVAGQAAAKAGMREWRWASQSRESKGQTEPAPCPQPGWGREEEPAQHWLLRASSGEGGKE